MSRMLFKNARWWRNGEPANVLVEHGRVINRGEEAQAADETTDLHGMFIMPGFVDCHCHILATGLDLLMLDLTGCESREEVLQKVGKRAESTPQNDWLLAVHYDQTRFADGRHITADELETATHGRPAILRHASGHACIANRTALIDATTKDVSGGEIVRGEDGKPTGVLLENAMQIVYNLLSEPTRQEMSDAILAAARSMNGMGITSAADMGIPDDLDDQIWAYQDAIERGARLRIRLYPNWSQFFKKTPELKPTPMLRINGVKLYADGAIGSATAAIHDKYTVGGNGRLIYSPTELQRRVQVADAAGHCIAIHSIGDRSTDVVLDALEITRDPRKHRIEHVMLLSNDQIRRIKALGIKVTMQPEFLMRFHHAYVKQLGTETASHLKRTKSLFDVGVPMGLSSDRPIVPGNPWDGIRCASQRPERFDQSENISVETAIALYTQGAADLNGDSDFGSLNPGQLADFQIYESSPLEGGVSPAAVYFGGEIVKGASAIL